MRIPRSAAVPLAVAILVAGCGSSGGSRLSSSAYTSQATKICKDSQTATNKLSRPTKPADVKPFLQKGINITQNSLNQLKKLNPPQNLQSEHDAVVKAEQSALDELQKVTDSLQGNAQDAAKVQKASPALDRISKDVDAKLKAAGLSACSGG